MKKFKCLECGSFEEANKEILLFLEDEVVSAQRKTCALCGQIKYDKELDERFAKLVQKKLKEKIMERDYNLYFNLMKEALEEKYKYIANYLRGERGIETIIDFGCGDGSLLRRISEDFPNIKLVGIDKPEIVKLYLKNEHPNANSNIKFMTEEDFCKEKEYYPNYGLIFSSVLHELYSYPYFSINELENIYKDAKAIFIRDMFFTDTKMVEHAIEDVLEKELQKENHDFYKKFEEKFSYFFTISNQQMAEFLMKYPYKRNWEEELKEDYFSTPWHDIHYKLLHNDFEIEHIRPHTNQFILKRTSDMGFNLSRYTATTHIELIFVKE